MYENKMVSRRTEERRYMCLIVIWYWYKSTIERILFWFSLLIGTLEVSGADLAIYLCQSEVTSHFSEDTFVGHAPPGFFRNLGLGNGIARISWGVFGAKYQGPTIYIISNHKEKGPI